MKKIITVLCLILTFFVIYFFQSNFFNNFTIYGIVPNIFIIYVLFIGLFANSTVGISIGIFTGLMLDLMYGRSIGISAVMYCIIGYLGTYFDKNFSKENKLTIILMCIGSTFIFEFGYYLLNSIILEFSREYLLFLRNLIIEIIYNVLITILLYPVIRKIGYAMDRTFKKKNILTRYF